MAWQEAAILGGLGLGGSLFSASSSKKATKKLIQWQDLLSRTAHQREVADLRAAGLNPVLSAMSGGSAVPGGAVPNIPDYGQAINTGVSNASQIALNKATKENIEGIAKQNKATGEISEMVLEKISKDPDFKAMFTGAKAASTAGLPAWLGLPVEALQEFFKNMRQVNKGTGNRNKTTINQRMIPLTGRPLEIPLQ